MSDSTLVWLKKNVLYEKETDTKFNFNTDRLVMTTSGQLAGWLIPTNEGWIIQCGGDYKCKLPKEIQDAFELGILMGDVDENIL